MDYKKHLKILSFLALGAIVLLVVFKFAFSSQDSEIGVFENTNKTKTEDRNQKVEIKTSNNTEQANDANTAELPKKISLDVPFTPQAPFGKWDFFHEEACEEASIIMVKYFLDKKTLDPETADREIIKMIEYEIAKLGHYEDSDAEEMVKIASEFYGLKNMKVIYDFKKEDLKQYLAQGKPIIVPAAGRLLGNPYFTQPGPLYHALVLRGYNGNNIITNDPGTKRGKGYSYNIDVLYNAIHDFPGDKENIESGRKAMIVLE